MIDNLPLIKSPSVCAALSTIGTQETAPGWLEITQHLRQELQAQLDVKMQVGDVIQGKLIKGLAIRLQDPDAPVRAG